MPGYRPPILRLHPRIGVLPNRETGAHRSVDAFHDRIDIETISQAYELRARLAGLALRVVDVDLDRGRRAVLT